MPARLCLVLPLVSFLLCHDSALAQQVWMTDPAATQPCEVVGCPIRFTLRQDVGEHIGYDKSLTQLGMFLPFGESAGHSLTFVDLQPTFYNNGQFGCNLGLGYRFYSAAHARTYGVYGYLDYRETEYNSFGQLTLGFDSLGSLLDVRGNLYLPNQRARQLPPDAVTAPHFVGHQLRMGGYECAMLGGDLEIGLVLPEFLGTQSRLLGGVYAFDAHGDDDGSGMRVRLETHWASWLATDVAVYHDDAYGTTGVVGVELSWQPELTGKCAPEIVSLRRGPYRHITRHAADRLGEPVRRLPNIAVGRAANVARYEDRTWRFIHVVEGAEGGDGTFERPFGKLEDAMAVAGPDDIVYTPYGGTFQPTQMLVVPQAVSLLSQINEHWVETQHGIVQIPFSGTSDAAAVINSSLQLDSGTTVNGFQIIGIADTLDGAGIVQAIGESGILFVDNVVQSRNQGLWLEDITESLIYANRIQARAEGIYVDGGAQLTFVGNDVASTESDAISVSNAGNVNLTDNTVSQAAGNGLLLDGVAGAAVDGNRVQSAAGSGIEVRNSANARIGANRIGNVGRDGIALEDVGDAWIIENKIDAAGQIGIGVTRGDGVTINANQITQANDHGIAVQEVADVRVGLNALSSTGGDGIHVTDGTLVNISQNTLAETYGDAVHIRAAETAVIDQNQISLSHRMGVKVEDVESVRFIDNELNRTYDDAFHIARADDATGNNNQIEFTGGHGFALVDTATIALGGNILEEAIGNGIHIEDDSLVVDGTVDLSGNTIGRSQTGIHIDLSGDFYGQVSGNEVAHNRGYGMFLRAATMLPQEDLNGNPAPASVEANRFHYNLQEGLVIEVTGAGDSHLEVRGNEFKLNNAPLGVQGGEYVTRLEAGAGPFTVHLNDNQSYNELPAGQYNYDFLNASGSELRYEITDPNWGTVGSSDSSVPAP